MSVKAILQGQNDKTPKLHVEVTEQGKSLIQDNEDVTNEVKEAINAADKDELDSHVSNTIMHTTAEEKSKIANAVQSSRKINNMDLSTDRTITAENIVLSPTDPTTVSTALKYRCNPNLLDNWYFANPVNQRKQTSYSGNMKYCIDRWCNRGNSTSLVLESDGIVINTDGGSFNAIVQAVENGVEDLAGKTVTFSALVTENTQQTEVSYLMIGNGAQASAVGTILCPINYFKGTGLFSVTTTIPTTLTNKYITLSICAGSKSELNKRFKIAAAKLELGDIQTLAHKENNTWVLNEIPNYGEQLRKCQRYFYNSAFKTSGDMGFIKSEIFSQYSSDAYYASGSLFPVTMRAIPVITFYSSPQRNANKVSYGSSGQEAIAVPEPIAVGVNGFGQITLRGSDSLFIGNQVQYFYTASADL